MILAFIIRDIRHSIQLALDIQQAEQHLRAVVPSSELSLIMSEVEQREDELVPVMLTKGDRLLDIYDEIRWEPLGRLRALRSVYLDYTSGELH
jgi:hypothetical protein